jgi:hypothetical protein
VPAERLLYEEVESMRKSEPTARSLNRPTLPSKVKVVRTAALIGVGVIAFTLGVLVRRRQRRKAVSATAQPEVRGPSPQATGSDHPADTVPGRPGKNEDERLDEAIQETFPASDPVSIKIDPPQY